MGYQRAVSENRSHRYQPTLPAGIALNSMLRELGLTVPLGLFCFLMGVVVLLFGSYHVYLVIRNTTTNETFKWQDVFQYLKSIVRRRKRRAKILEQRAAKEVNQTKEEIEQDKLNNEISSSRRKLHADDSDSKLETIDLPDET